MTINLTKFLAFWVLLTIAVGVPRAYADSFTIDDPLHGFCGSNANTSSCTDNGVITPVSGTLGSFGFYASPGNLIGTDWLTAILVPTNIAGAGNEHFTLSDTAGIDNTADTNVTATRVSATAWTSGDLANYLSPYGLSTSNTNPANPISAFEVQTDASVTGFYVYVADLGSTELLKQSSSIGGATGAPILTLGGTSSLQAGMEITSFLLGTGQNTPNIATAPSSVLQYTGTGSGGGGGGQAPEPASLLLLGSGLGLAGFRIRRRQKVSA